MSRRRPESLPPGGGRGATPGPGVPRGAGEVADRPGAGSSGDARGVAGAADGREPDAADAALARARVAASAKGLRPGRPGARRRKDRPAGGGPASAGRDPRLLGDQIDEFIDERGWRTELSVGSVLGRWDTIVGPEVAQHCHPVEFIEGVLTVRAESTAWATQLRLLAVSMLGALAAEVGEGVVTDVRIVGPSAPSWSRGSLRATDGRGPRDTYG